MKNYYEIKVTHWSRKFTVPNKRTLLLDVENVIGGYKVDKIHAWNGHWYCAFGCHIVCFGTYNRMKSRISADCADKGNKE